MIDPIFILNVVRVLALLGSIQGFFLFILLFKKRKIKSSFYLSLYLFSFSIYIGLYAEPSFKLYLNYPYILVLLDFIPLFYTPLLYFYFFYALNKRSKPRYPIIVHQIPAFLNFLLIHGWYFYIGPEKFRAYLFQAFFETPHMVIQIDNWGKYISGIIYGYLICKLIIVHARNSPDWKKNHQQRNWLIALVTVYTFCWSIVIITGVVIYYNKMDQNIVRGFLLFQLASLTVAMYLIAYFAFMHPTLFQQERIREKISKKLNFGEQKLDQLKLEFERIMVSEHFYLDENITLQSTAQRMGIHANALSYLVNETYQKNFNEFINDLRLRRFLELAKTNRDSTILRLAFDSGFPSKTTFNRAFKSRFNRTPAEYIKDFS